MTDAETASALDYAREQGRLSGEVRMLKWAVGAAFVALIAALGAIYTEMNQGFRDVNQRFQDVSMRIDQLTDGVTDVRERLTRIEGLGGLGGLGERRDSAGDNADRPS